MFLVGDDNSSYTGSAHEARTWHDSADGNGGGGENSMDVASHRDGCAGGGGTDDGGGKAGSAVSDPLDLHLLARDINDDDGVPRGCSDRQGGAHSCARPQAQDCAGGRDTVRDARDSGGRPAAVLDDGDDHSVGVCSVSGVGDRGDPIDTDMLVRVTSFTVMFLHG